VTATTITLVLRKTSDYDPLAQSTGTPSFEQIAHDEEVLVGFFNRQYELYGRHVVVKTFNGVGSLTEEAGNQDQAGASADAQTAHDMGGFVDGFHAFGTYADAESSRHIINVGPNSLASYKADFPYHFGEPVSVVEDTAGAGMASMACQRMAHMPAIFAGDATDHAMTRTFAVIEPEQPEDAGGANVLVRQMQSKCGVSVKKIQYNLDVSTEAGTAAQIDAQLKAANITTVMMLTDPLMPIFMTQAAARQQYQPEWVFAFDFGSPPLARNADASEMAHSINLNAWDNLDKSPDNRMCHRIYKLADPTGTPQSESQLDIYCSILLTVFGTLQQAGPNLTPQTFASAWFHQPDSNGGGDFGHWSYGTDQWSPDSTFSLWSWNGQAHNPYDGGTGTFVRCADNADYTYLNPSLGSGQLHCLGN